MTAPDLEPVVECAAREGGWHCSVVLGDSEHSVQVDRDTLDDLAPGRTPDDLVRASFTFLLEREPPESIMRSFELPMIGRFFADYPDEMRRRLGGSGPTSS
jgi:hypothetical protein